MGPSNNAKAPSSFIMRRGRVRVQVRVRNQVEVVRKTGKFPSRHPTQEKAVPARIYRCLTIDAEAEVLLRLRIVFWDTIRGSGMDRYGAL